MSFDLSNAATQETTNYLVPSSGGTHAIPIAGVLSAAPVVLDWRNFNSDSFPFQPQGAYIDNSAGTGPLTLEIFAGESLVWTVVVDTGYVMHANFPAPNGQVHSVTGLGQATIVFVDFPVLPFYYKP
jgi:hypothetical protein